MTGRERIRAVFAGRLPDRTPRCEFWIDAFLAELGQADLESAHVGLGQDSIMLPTRSLPGSAAWTDGVDEWGRCWRAGSYVGGLVADEAGLRRYSVDPARAPACFDAGRAARIRATWPDHCLMYGSHLGPFMGAYMAMGFEALFLALADGSALVEAIMEDRCRWAIAMFQEAERQGAELFVLGDDLAHKGGPMISPELWRRLVLPFHRRIVESVGGPVVFHSDGNLMPVLDLVVEAGFSGLHGLEPAAGMSLARLKEEWGHRLVLVGNADLGILADRDLGAVRAEVDRCLGEGSPGGRYMLATCNSVYGGLDPASVREFFHRSMYSQL